MADSRNFMPTGFACNGPPLGSIALVPKTVSNDHNVVISERCFKGEDDNIKAMVLSWAYQKHFGQGEPFENKILHSEDGTTMKFVVTKARVMKSIKVTLEDRKADNDTVMDTLSGLFTKLYVAGSAEQDCCVYEVCDKKMYLYYGKAIEQYDTPKEVVFHFVKSRANKRENVIAALKNAWLKIVEGDSNIEWVHGRYLEWDSSLDDCSSNEDTGDNEGEGGDSNGGGEEGSEDEEGRCNHTDCMNIGPLGMKCTSSPCNSDAGGHYTGRCSSPDF